MALLLLQFVFIFFPEFQDKFLKYDSSNSQLILGIFTLITIFVIFLIVYFLRLISIDISKSVWDYSNVNPQKFKFRNWLRSLNSTFLRVSFFDLIFILPIYILRLFLSS